MHDAKRYLASNGFQIPEDLPVSNISYADDTLIVNMESTRAQQFKTYISRAGAKYGLAFNWRKLEDLSVRCNAQILKPDGNFVTEKNNLVYLGSVFSNDGLLNGELSRCLGSAHKNFQTLCKIWSHSNLCMQRKIRIFEACVISKWLDCLHTA